MLRTSATARLSCASDEHKPMGVPRCSKAVLGIALVAVVWPVLAFHLPTLIRSSRSRAPSARRRRACLSPSKPSYCKRNLPSPTSRSCLPRPGQALLPGAPQRALTGASARSSGRPSGAEGDGAGGRKSMMPQCGRGSATAARRGAPLSPGDGWGAHAADAGGQRFFNKGRVVAVAVARSSFQRLCPPLPPSAPHAPASRPFARQQGCPRNRSRPLRSEDEGRRHDLGTCPSHIYTSSLPRALPRRTLPRHHHPPTSPFAMEKDEVSKATEAETNVREGGRRQCCPAACPAAR